MLLAQPLSQLQVAVQEESAAGLPCRQRRGDGRGKGTGVGSGAYEISHHVQKCCSFLLDLHLVDDHEGGIRLKWMPIFYLSFQRAPPINASPNEVISISPTIVNDLRDEVYQPDVPLKIQLAWVGRRERSWRKLYLVTEYLWEGSQSAYRQCQVKVPDKSLLHGFTTIHLALWAESDASAIRQVKKGRIVNSEHWQWIFDIGGLSYPEENHLAIIPVLSTPINILSNANEASKSSGKSSSIIRLFRIEDSPVVEICEESGYELDKHIWDASLYLSSYISKSLKDISGARAPFLSSTRLRKGLKVVELGAGTGTVSIFLSTLLHQGESVEADSDQGCISLTATDLLPAIPLLDRNIDTNSDLAGLCHMNCQPLDWMTECQIEGTALILVSDCTYNPTYFKPLCGTIKSLLTKGQEGAVCLLAKKHRHIDEEGLWEVVESNGLLAVLLAGQHAVQEGLWGLWEIRCK
jgi:hypothetical protein